MVASSNNYKNTMKKLRKINSSLINERKKQKLGNYYKYLTEEEEIESEPKEECKKIVREKRANIDFNDLPEDTIYKILQFLSANTRLAILKHKYNRSFVKCKLQKMPENKEELTKLWRCAIIAYNLLKNMLCDCVFQNISSYSVKFAKQGNLQLYSRYYKENFTEIILTAIRHYSRIYKFGYYTNKKVIEHVEQIMLNIFAHLTMMK